MFFYIFFFIEKEIRMPKIDSFEAPREEVQVDDLALHNVYQVCTLHGEPTIKQQIVQIY